GQQQRVRIWRVHLLCLAAGTVLGGLSSQNCMLVSRSQQLKSPSRMQRAVLLASEQFSCRSDAAGAGGGHGCCCSSCATSCQFEAFMLHPVAIR
ncbi:hypothetical protein COO60DRAFT_1528149, partial [Scenedesmus sp. NREL 46B-D3]